MTDAALGTHATISVTDKADVWRWYRPGSEHPEGFTFGFVYRFVAGFVSVLTWGAFLFLGGLLTDWTISPVLLVLFGIGTSLTILLAEHMRTRTFERLVEYHRLETEREKNLREFDTARVSQLLDFELSRKVPIGTLIRKSFIDRIVAFLAILLVLPLLILIAALVKVDKKGPIFVLSTRYNFDGTTFKIIRFRTTTSRPVEDPEESITKLQSDPRITRVGTFLRRTRLDELPQLVNVLKGDMSIVGPRPLIDYKLLGDEGGEVLSALGRIYGRLGIKSGLTGLAQVSAPGEGFSERTLELDLEYARYLSFWLDLRIVARTFALTVVETAR